MVLSLLLLVSPAQAALWTGLLDDSRAVDWSQAGVRGGIPMNRTQCGTAIAAYTGTAVAINTAIANCPSGQYVKLGAGTFRLSNGITFDNKSNVTLRGSGPDQTFLVFTGEHACGGIGGNICMISNAAVTVYASYTANWIGGFSRGSTALTFSHTNGLAAGMHILLDQTEDGATDRYPNLWACHAGPTVCSVIASPGERDQYQLVTVTSVNGPTVSITPGIYLDNWRSDRAPLARWESGQPATGQGLEDLSIDGTNSPSGNNVGMLGVVDSWVKNIRSIKPVNHHVKLMAAPNNTIRNSYFFALQDETGTSESYGVDLYYSGDDLVENNIFQRLPSPQVCEYGWNTVFAYNVGINNNFGGPGNTWGTLDGVTHRVGCNFLLWEGNDGMGVMGENYHGAQSLNTVFRNRYRGSQLGKDANTVPVYIGGYSRFWNIVGNVLGDPAWATNYDQIAGTDASDSNVCNHSIYSIGWGGMCDSGGSEHPPDDPRTAPTLLRWGNWDTVTGPTGGPRFVASEVPSGLSKYANAVPASNPTSAVFFQKH